MPGGTAGAGIPVAEARTPRGDTLFPGGFTTTCDRIKLNYQMYPRFPPPAGERIDAPHPDPPHPAAAVRRNARRQRFAIYKKNLN